MAIEHILIVDDDELTRYLLQNSLEKRGYGVASAENGRKALKLIKEKSFDLVISDLKMPDLTGIELLQKIKEHSPQTLVVVITAYGSIDTAVEAMHLGAFHYMVKPFSPDHIEAVIEKAKQHMALVHENQYLKQEASHQGSTSLVIGESTAIKKIMEEVKIIAQSDASVFISGESGTGKEVIAQAIHHQSIRVKNPYIKVNCAAIPETLIEAEFFGHEKGAFTGATARRLGRFELANKGTLLLDEITEIPLMLQAKMLRVIQEQEFERIGGIHPVKVDVRLISTSNRNLQQMIAEHAFREDLFYRLNVIPIHIPPLRERKEDIIPLARHFVEKFSQKNTKEKKQLDSATEQKLLTYNWPGNVRELANVLERAVVLSPTSRITAEQILLN